MKITKFGHCCLYIEHKGIKILTDPGAYSTSQDEITGVDIILITHEHPDHLHIDSLKKVLTNNPNAKIITNFGVGVLLEKENIFFEKVEDGQYTEINSLLIEGFGSHHEEIYKELGQVQNTGYFIDNILFYPGDAFTNPGKQVEILATPIAGPWTTFKKAMEYVLEIKPRICFPVHDGMFITGRGDLANRLAPKILEGTGIIFTSLKESETKEF